MKIKFSFLLLIILLMFACKQKPSVDFSGNTTIELKDFVAALKPIQLPVQISDTTIYKYLDTVTVGKKLLTRFFTDSIFKKNNLTDKHKIQLIGKIEKENEKYLLINFSNNKKNDVIVFVLDEKNNFVTSKNILSNNNSDGYFHSVSINKEPSFIMIKEKHSSEKQQLLYTKIGWAYTATVGSFITVVNETNEDEKRNNEIINPIDTLPRKFKLSGNYIQNAKNFISLRDGKSPNTYLFFLHIEKQDGSCIGEIKGELKMTSETVGIFSESGDPCLIDFTFKGNELTVKEQGSCGNYRDIKCYFDDTYTRKKEVLPKKKK